MIRHINYIIHKSLYWYTYEDPGLIAYDTNNNILKCNTFKSLLLSAKETPIDNMVCYLKEPITY